MNAKAGPYDCDGVQSSFDFSFKPLNSSYVTVYVNDDVVSSGYTVAVNGSAGYCYYNGGNDATYNGVKLQNNLFQNFTTGGLGVALFFSEDNVKKTQMLNNVFYNASSDVMVKDYAADINALNNFVDSHASEASIWMQHYPFNAGSDVKRWWLDQCDPNYNTYIKLFSIK